VINIAYVPFQETASDFFIIIITIYFFFYILSLFHPLFKSNKVYKRTSISVFVPKKDKTNNLTMNSHFTVTVTGSSGLVWPISQKWSILNNTSFFLR